MFLLFWGNSKKSERRKWAKYPQVHLESNRDSKINNVPEILDHVIFSPEAIGCRHYQMDLNTEQMPIIITQI